MKKKTIRNKPSQVSKKSVIDDLGLTDQESKILKAKIALHQAALAIIKKEGYTSRELEKIFNQPQPRVSEFLGGKISKMSIEKLMNYLFCLKADLHIIVNSQVKKIA